MSGFPVRPTRDNFGPTYQDTRPIRDSRKNLPAAVFNLHCHQVSGLGVVSALCWLEGAIIAGPDVELAAHAEAWNPNGLETSEGDYDPPVLVRTDVGIYTFAYASTYPDEEGAAQATNLSKWAGGALDETNDASQVSVKFDDAVSGTIKVFDIDLDGSPQLSLADLPFWVAFW